MIMNVMMMMMMMRGIMMMIMVNDITYRTDDVEENIGDDED